MDSDDNTPLHLAAEQGNAHAAWLLLRSRAPVDILNKSLMTPLSCAIASPRGAQVAGLLLQHGADPNFRLSDGTTPLHTAVASGDPAMVSLLLAHSADMTSRDHAHETPLGSAVSRGHHAIVDLLVRACPRTAAAIALHDRLLPRAVKMGFPRVADLLRYGCGPVDGGPWGGWPCDAPLADEVF
jgi:ankyrin repeat protein